MQYKCIRGTVTSRGPIKEGDIVSLPANEAVVLIAAKRLVIAEEEIRIAEAPAVEHRDPVTPKKGRFARGR